MTPLSRPGTEAKWAVGAIRRDPVRTFYTVAAVLLVGYGSTLLVRSPGQYWPVLDDLMLDVFEVSVAVACLARARRPGPGRRAALALGAGLLAWALGDVTWTIQPYPTTPSLADAFYLAFYPLAFAALLLLVRPDLSRVPMSAWIDGVIAGLGAAAICAAFAFDTIVAAVGGSATALAVNLAYPIGDLVLLAMAIGAVVIVPGRPAALVLFAAACSLMAVADTIYLVQSSLGTYQVGTPLDLTWPAGLFAMSLSIWLPARAAAPSVGADRAPRFALPGLASVAGLVILLLGTEQHMSTVAVALAAAVLVAAGIRMLLSLRDLKRMTEARHRQAVTDELTGLGNRRRFLDELERALSGLAQERRGAGLALLLIDLDHFKEINDSFGHPTGDTLLRQIGPRLQRVLRPGDPVARLGGDEFAVVLTGADARYAAFVARRITDALSEPMEVDTASLHIGASIGIAVAPGHGTTASELLRCADVAMYRAKAAHSGFDLYEAALDDGGYRLRLVEDLRVALTENALTVHYQPEIDLTTGHVVTVEALLRWPHPSLGTIPPEDFLPLAEESGLIRPLTAWVLRQAVSDCARWWNEGHHVPVAVNVLATDLLDTALPRRVQTLLSGTRLPAQALILEITETMVMADLTRAKQVIGHLSDVGILVSIDDFGTGFSSLAYLSDLAVGELKLDRMFITRLQEGHTGGRDDAIVRSAIDLGHALGLRVVAEGIERLGLIPLLAGLGCDKGQGFAIAPPRPSGELTFAPLSAHAPTP